MATTKPTRTGNRRDFVRTQVPYVERFSSAAILLLLAGIGVAIAIKGRHYNPDLYDVRPDSLNSTASAVEGKSQTLKAEGAPPAAATTAAAETATPAAQTTTATATPSGETTGDTITEPQTAPAKPATASAEGDAGAEGSSDTPKPAPIGEPLVIALDGLQPMSDTEFYNSDTLYEKIDGRSPAYQSFNVTALRCRTFNVLAAAGSFVDVYEYRFDTPVDAFGMYAMERDPKGGPLDFIADGYSGEMGYFFRQGTVYVQVMASDQKPETLALTRAIAQNRAKVLPVDDSGLAGRRRMPADGMIPGSVSYVPDNAQGQSSLHDVFQAKYGKTGAEIPFFIMVAPAADAAKAWQSFQDFCSRFGKAEVLPDVSGGKLFRAQVFGKWKVIYVREGELGGTFDVADPEAARTFVEKYLRGEIK